MLCACMLCLSFWSVAGAFCSLFRVAILGFLFVHGKYKIRLGEKTCSGGLDPHRKPPSTVTQSQWKTDKSKEMHAVTYSLKTAQAVLLLIRSFSDFRLDRSWARCLDAVAACCLVRFSLLAWWELEFRSWIRVGVTCTTLHARWKTGRSFRKGAVGL